jgi:hypothetical protein
MGLSLQAAMLVSRAEKLYLGRLEVWEEFRDSLPNISVHPRCFSIASARLVSNKRAPEGRNQCAY